MLSLLDNNLSEDEIQNVIQAHLSKYGIITRRAGGMCGTIYFFDQGENVHPRWVAVKIPRAPKDDRQERNRRFAREMELQHRTYRHTFVCWPADYTMILDTPAGIYRASDGDLAQLIPNADFTVQSRLAVLAYLCSALKHCRSRGIECHQDLKPQNILVRDITALQRSLPDQKVFTFPQLADFGLANTWIDDGKPLGAKPYMAPEQWLEGRAIAASDIFALGIIIFETMTLGHHPIGGITREWWPEPADGNSKRWLRDDVWSQWAKKGAPIVQAELLVEGVDSIVRQCLMPNAADRPSLEAIQTQLLGALKKVDPEAASQASFQASHADHDAASDEWPYRDQQLQRLMLSIDRELRPF